MGIGKKNASLHSVFESFKFLILNDIFHGSFFYFVFFILLHDFIVVFKVLTLYGFQLRLQRLKSFIELFFFQSIGEIFGDFKMTSIKFNLFDKSKAKKKPNRSLSNFYFS